MLELPRQQQDLRFVLLTDGEILDGDDGDWRADAGGTPSNPLQDLVGGGN